MRSKVLILTLLIGLILSCGSSKEYVERESSVEEQLDDQNRPTTSLLNQITKEPGVTIRGGVPVFTRNASNRRRNPRLNEPLYVLNDMIIGNSFRKLQQLVQPADVKNIETIQGSETSFYGARGSNGVIKITTF